MKRLLIVLLFLCGIASGATTEVDETGIIIGGASRTKGPIAITYDPSTTSFSTIDGKTFTVAGPFSLGAVAPTIPDDTGGTVSPPVITPAPISLAGAITTWRVDNARDVAGLKRVYSWLSSSNWGPANLAAGQATLSEVNRLLNDEAVGYSGTNVTEKGFKAWRKIVTPIINREINKPPGATKSHIQSVYTKIAGAL